MIERKRYIEQLNQYTNSNIELHCDEELKLAWDEIINDITPFKISDKPESIYWFDDQGNWYFDVDLNKNYLFCSRQLVVLKYYIQFGFSYEELCFFIRQQTIKNINLNKFVILPIDFTHQIKYNIEMAVKESITL